MNRDLFTLEIVKDALVAIGHEMFDAMIRTSMSPIIYETTDFEVGVTDACGNLIAQGNGVTAFMATLDTAVQSASQVALAPAVSHASPRATFRMPSPQRPPRTHLVVQLP